MGSLTRKETAEYLLSKDHITIMTHRRPDGDTIGSAAVLCMGLRQLGKEAAVLENPEVTEKYMHLHQGLTKPCITEGDTIVCVDVASAGMLPEAFLPMQDWIDLRIDHHGVATSFTPNELVDPEAAACGEIIYDVLKEMGVELDIPMANALYTAVSTDTGCFRYANTTPHSFLVAAECAQVSGDLFRINQALFETNTLGRLRIQGYLVENARFLADGKIVVCTIPYAIEQEWGLTEDDLDNISGFPRTIEGVKIAATLRENAEGKVKLSVRAVPGYDAAEVCARFGGGGHKGAAGANMDMTLTEAADAVAQAMLELA